ncbi:MAG: radical SAM protein, partial [Deltaproteobacteria bacterium]|nr:radical SAM protein [Deltaproteobacteria bacterium]
MNVVLITPPSTQLNTPYPATAYLRRYLAGLGVEADQVDFGIELFHALFCREGLELVFEATEAAAGDGLPDPAWHALACRERHLAVIDPVVAFLVGVDPASATAWARPGSLPMGPRLRRAAADRNRFGAMGITDWARYRCSLYLEDLADLITAVVDPGFGFSRYQHYLAVGPVQFDPMVERLS